VLERRAMTSNIIIPNYSWTQKTGPNGPITIQHTPLGTTLFNTRSTTDQRIFSTHATTDGTSIVQRIHTSPPGGAEGFYTTFDISNNYQQK
jgi:hypothetical protein